MTLAERIIDALEGRREGSSWRCVCPLHDGRHLIVTPREGQAPLLKCMVGAKQYELLDALSERGLWESRNGASSGGRRAESGESARELPQQPFSAGRLVAPAGSPKLVAEYHYTDERGDVIAIKGRFEPGKTRPKEFAWRLPDGDWKAGLQGTLLLKDLPLYGLQHLSGEGPVLFVEGEKAAQACWEKELMAVCPPGGSALKDLTPKMLKPLAGLEVIVWPDNDEPGRMLARAVRAKLEDIAASVRVFAPAGLADGADAHDYFQDHNADDLWKALSEVPDKPHCTETPTGYLVDIPESGGLLHFQFDSLDERSHTLEADVSTWQEITGATRQRFSARLNLLSLSNREAYRRELDNIFGKGFWTGALSLACEVVREHHAQRDWSIPLSSVSDADPGYLCRPFLLADGPTVLFGHGDAGKSYLFLALAIAVIRAAPFLGFMPERTGRVLFVDYEATETRTKRRLRRLGLTVEEQDDFIYWPGRRSSSFASILPALRRCVDQRAVALIGIDSALLACGGSPQDEGLVGAYFNALARLEVPSITIAHLPKDDTKGEHPFGSVFWANCARITWNVQAGGEPEENPKHIGLFNRKANEDMRHRPIGARLTFSAEAVTLEREELSIDSADRTAVAERIRNLLKRPGGMSVKELVGELGLPENSIRTSLRRHHAQFLRLGPSPDGSGQWVLRAT